MRPTEQQPAAVRGGFTFVLVAALIVSFLQYAIHDMSAPTLDSLRYADYALNIHDHQVFGLSGRQRDVKPRAGNANSPLYPAFVAATMTLDPKLADSLRCVLAAPDQAASCPADYTTLVTAQCVLVVGALGCLWFAAMWLFGRPLLAYGACGFALASTKLMFFANLILTEVLVLFLFAALMAALVAARRSARARSWALIGLILGALTLTRPEYLYLALILLIVGAVATVIGTARRGVIRLLAAAAMFALVLAPWLARNEHHFGKTAITGGYGDVILAYRAGYNRMSGFEWAAAFIAWLPGYGDMLAAKLLPPHTVAKLGTGPDSYLYRDGKEIFDAGLAAVGGDRDRLTGYLIRTEMLEHPFRHVYTSIPLAWRGILAGKYLAVAGVPCLAALLGWAIRRRQLTILLLSLPPSVMIGLYAAVSASVPRYNVYLVFYYGLAVSWALISLYERRAVLPESVH